MNNITKDISREICKKEITRIKAKLSKHFTVAEFCQLHFSCNSLQVNIDGPTALTAKAADLLEKTSVPVKALDTVADTVKKLRSGNN